MATSHIISYALLASDQDHEVSTYRPLALSNTATNRSLSMSARTITVAWPAYLRRSDQEMKDTSKKKHEPIDFYIAIDLCLTMTIC